MDVQIDLPQSIRAKRRGKLEKERRGGGEEEEEA